MYSIIWLISTIIDIYIWIILASVILNWLVSFNVVNRHNQIVHMIGDFCHRATEPALKPIRRLLPDLGQFDLSPIALILALTFVRYLLVVDVGGAVGTYG